MSGVRVVKDESKRVLTGLEALARARVLVGVPAATSARKADPEVKAGPILNAGLAYLHENGAPKSNIPARPFLVPGVRDAAPGAIAHMKAGALAELQTPGGLEKGLHRAGLHAQAVVKKRIVAQEGFAPLSPRTLKARLAAGFNGTKALIRTAQLLNSITYVVRPWARKGGAGG